MIHQNAELLISEQGLSGIKSIAKTFGISVSELLEQIGTGNLVVIDPEALEDQLDLQEALETLTEAEARGETPMTWEAFEAELNTLVNNHSSPFRD